MRVQEVQVVVEEDGLVELDALPVKIGDRLRIIVLMPDESAAPEKLYPLHGVGPYRFDDPTSPVAPEDWEP